MSGALAERVFVSKMEKLGFTEIEVVERVPFGIEEAAVYPLFGDDLIELMRELIPESRHHSIATSVTVTARVA
ncbi:MAG TPA: hypothetical protein VMM14_07800 [Acidimicrobiia bacterium]|nr:hypothetical protein [Acidimicrobiia bacterium]